MKKVKKYRKIKGLTQNELAYKAGISQPFIAEIERGRKSPSVRTLVKIAKVLNVSLEKLL